MSVNGPLKMYKVRPLYDFSPAIDFPTCMYKMSNLYGEVTGEVACAKQENQGCHLTFKQLQIALLQDEVNLLEIEKHQLNILQKLEDLKSKVLAMKDDLGIKNQKSYPEAVPHFQDIVVKANPENPPLSLWVFYKLLSQSLPVRLISFVHSSLVNVPDQLKQLQNLHSSESARVSLSIIWRNDKTDTQMVISPFQHGIIEGEVNIARYIARMLHFNYDSDPIVSTQIDNWLETVHSLLIHGNNKDRQATLKSLNSHLGKNSFLVADSVSLADIVLWSALVQTRLHTSLPSNVQKWFNSLMDSDLFCSCKNLPFL